MELKTGTGQPWLQSEDDTTQQREGDPTPPCGRRNSCRYHASLQCDPKHRFAVDDVTGRPLNHMKDRPPMPSRDSGGPFSLYNPDDGTPITQMVKLNEEFFLIITEKCTYRLQVADQIDPDPKDPALPQNFQQKLFDHGTKSDLLCRTLLQAKVMFRRGKACDPPSHRV